jgi:hypothetical protein
LCGLLILRATRSGCIATPPGPASRWMIYQLTTTAETRGNGVRFNARFVLP